MPEVAEPAGSCFLFRQMPNGLTPNFTCRLVLRTAAWTWAISLLTFSRRQSASGLPRPYFR